MPRLDRVKDREALPKNNGAITWERVRHRRGLALGYRPSSGVWFARGFAKGKLEYARLGSAGDLSYSEALDKAQAWFRQVRGDAPRGYNVLAAIEDYAISKTADLPKPESARVWDDLRTVTKHVTGELLKMELSELKTAHLERWRNSLRVKPATRKRVFNVVCAALTNAHRLHKVGDLNEWRSVKPIKIPAKDRSRLFLPKESEVKDLLAKCDADFALMVKAALHTAMRYGEIASLEARDFDPENGKLNLRTSKTGGRSVLLSSAAVQFFKEQCADKLPRARIFTTTDGAPWMPSMQHRRMRSSTDIRPFVFYSLRHYAFSAQLRAGIPAALVARNGGTSEAMLRQFYHKVEEADRPLFDRVAVFG